MSEYKAAIDKIEYYENVVDGFDYFDKRIFVEISGVDIYISNLIRVILCVGIPYYGYEVPKIEIHRMNDIHCSFELMKGNIERIPLPYGIGKKLTNKDYIIYHENPRSLNYDLTTKDIFTNVDKKIKAKLPISKHLIVGQLSIPSITGNKFKETPMSFIKLVFNVVERFPLVDGYMGCPIKEPRLRPITKHHTLEVDGKFVKNTYVKAKNYSKSTFKTPMQFVDEYDKFLIYFVEKSTTKSESHKDIIVDVCKIIIEYFRGFVLFIDKNKLLMKTRKVYIDYKSYNKLTPVYLFMFRSMVNKHVNNVKAQITSDGKKITVLTFVQNKLQNQQIIKNIIDVLNDVIKTYDDIIMSLDNKNIKKLSKSEFGKIYEELKN